MHDESGDPQAPRYIPFKQGGWGTALFVCALAVVTALTAYYVHQRTYLAPTDVRNRAIGGETSHG